ncbi:alpha-hydroxy-acid oxidizing protein [Rhodophyticola sp. CCM32]|uniref:alpha-hydroxy acid oxidase n=1 Tax=Rhodophyticola sp. CCM32 TaxID=2916397 RepID=UPI00107F7673|nr:alpha-hydroxy acid oxidase [Rhodophyticola sp. CCM32]QBY01439.1 alpha-hydroxy-acid oxidizing protein [Rhodophyticola sp. CCM32]
MRQSHTIVNIDDLRLRAKAKLPKIFFDYIDGGAFSETTMRRNRCGFQRWELVQHVLRTSENPSLKCTYLDQDQTLPFMLGPVGFLGLYRGNGEVQAAQAAKNRGIPLCLSTFSISSIETLRREVGGQLHFQLYMDRDKSFVEKLLDAAVKADTDVLYLTVDTSVTSVREKDVRNGFRAVTRLNARLLFSMMQKPAWCLDMLKTGSSNVEAVRDFPEFGTGALEQASNLSGRLDPSLTWDDVKWLRQKWKKKLVIKGILCADDAKTARDCGVDAIVISNHGGRQLDFASSTIARLPSIREAVGREFCVMIDGGFRRGSEIIIALGLGASCVLLGRAYAFGLSAGGQSGVEKAIDILADEIAISLKLMGLNSVAELQEAGAECVRSAGS